MSFYSEQEPRTTAAYIDNRLVRQTFDDSLAVENGIKTELLALNPNVRFIERIVFGSGRTALVFRTRS